MVCDAEEAGGDGRHQHQAPAGLAVLVGVLADEELGAGVEAKDVVVEVLGHVFGLLEALGAGIGDDDVDFAVVGLGGFEEGGDFAGAGHVGCEGDGVAAVSADFRYYFVGGGFAFGVVYDDGGAAGAELDGDASADAAG